MERVLADIDADHGDCALQLLGHGVLLVFGAPSQHPIAGGAGARPDHPISGHAQTVGLLVVCAPNSGIRSFNPDPVFVSSVGTRALDANTIAAVGGDMRRFVTPSIVIALGGMLVGFIYRYFADDPTEAPIGNYARSGIHGMGTALSGWVVHLYFTSRGSEWIRRWPLWLEICGRSTFMAIVVATVVLTLQVALYGRGLEATWLAAKFPKIFVIAFVMSVIIGAMFELMQ